MSQDIFNDINPTVTTGLMLAGLLDDFKDALMSGFSGTSRPANLQAGGMWVDTTLQSAPDYYWIFKIYNGVTDIEVLRVSVLSGTSGFGLAKDAFTIRKISADTAGAILNLVKNRIDNSGQILSGDTVAELRITGRTNTSTDPIVAYLRATASEDQTNSNSGVTLSIASALVGTNQLLEHVRFLTGLMEITQPHKINSLVLGSDSIATAASLLLTDDKVLSELTGSTTANIHGIEVDPGTTRVKYIHNRSTAEVTIKNESFTASATQRFSLPNSADMIVLPQGTAAFYYCTTDTRWKYLAGHPAGVRSFIYNFVTGYSEWVAPFTGSVRVISYQEPIKEPSETASNSGFSKLSLNYISAWGDNTYGQLGVGDVTPRSAPVAVLGGIQFRDAMISAESSCGVSDLGVAYAWGLNANGQLGVGDVLPRSSPVAVAGGLKFSRLEVNSSSFGIQYSGVAYAWGLNANGELGVGDVLPRSSPVAVLGGLVFAAIFHNSGLRSFGVTRDTGLLYAWGSNANGSLGVGDVSARSSPVAVLGGLKFRKVAVSGNATVGITESGIAYAWGLNTNGQLGVGDVTPRSSPVAVLGGLVFNDVVAIPGTLGAFIGITEDGVLYSWGGNADGQLGVGDVTPRSSPVAVLGGLNFESIARLNLSAASVIAIKKGTGLAYAWGANTHGQLGLSDILPRSSPVAIVGGLKFSTISMRNGWTYGAASDGVTYAWGSNANGQLGDSTTIAKSSPVAVMGLTEPLFRFPIVKVIPVVAGTTYKIKISGGISFFGTTEIGRNIRRATVAFEN